MTAPSTPMDLRDRITLVTGGTGVLGRAVTDRFLAEGARVHVPLRRPEAAGALRERLGNRAEALHLHPDADLTDPAAVSRLFRAVEASAGAGPEILLNLAGGFRMAPVEETSPEAWSGMLELNATTAFLSARAAFPGMIARGWGRIVNVSAFPALDRGKAGFSAYAAAKAAVLNLTSTLAREGAPHGITANALVPSIIDTPDNRAAMPDADRRAWLDPDEIAGVIAFLASPAARIVNGAALTLTLD